MLCSKCNENLAVVFITKIDEKGRQANEGLCLTCAKDMNLPHINNIISQMGVDPSEIDEMNKEMSEMFADAFASGEVIEPVDDPENPGSSNMNFNINKLRETLGINRMGGSEEEMPPPPHLPHQTGAAPAASARTRTRQKPNKRKYLEMYGTNLTAKAIQGKIDRVIGRETEIERMSQILNRRTKNNPCLIGEPGVGKTAIAEGLALRIATGEVPAKLLGYEIYLLDLSAVVAGTQFRGQFEARIKAIIDEVKRAGNIVLVIDEVHSIVTAGDAEGAMSAGAILKPALAKGEIQVIGATTLNEYRKHIEKDSALERRFQPVMVDEPSVDETIEIIKGIREYYEDYHKVKITDEIIEMAAILSERYINDRFLPDKAIDVIDEAASKVNLGNKSLVELEKLKIELKKVQDEKEDAASADSEEDYKKAAELKSRECKLLDDIANLEKLSENIYIQREDIAAVIEMWTKIPVKDITETETERLVNMEQLLHERVIGQNDAIDAVARAIRRGRAGISVKRRPVSFIFVGPTGVGKTELVKQLARVMFGSEEALIRLDMSEFMEKHSVSKLSGSPPGYVGYDDGGHFSEKVRRRPYSVILLDEVEKAHPDVFNMLLQILDDGKMTDGQGRVVSFENTVIVMTSNAGSNEKSNIAGFGGSTGIANKDKIDRALKDIFRPEFLNRVDEIVMFDELSQAELIEIITLMLADLAEGLSEKGISLNVTNAAKEHIFKNGYHRTFGARPLRRFIQRNIEDRLSDMLLRGEIRGGSAVTVGVREDELKFKVD
ncbi:MAG: ATP-dependent Clp protease ATP-binding subunit [Oscillospiraceae bacterium]|nr:ATP-dependent Clp protease ATP-binding subunit [Oscillospiraceae bacterium]